MGPTHEDPDDEGWLLLADYEQFIGFITSSIVLFGRTAPRAEASGSEAITEQFGGQIEKTNDRFPFIGDSRGLSQAFTSRNWL